VLVGLLSVLMRDEPCEPIDRMASDPRWPALGGYLGQVVFMAETAFVVARRSDDVMVTREADALAGSAFVIFAPIVLLVALQWRVVGAGRDGGRPAAPAQVVDDLGDAEFSTAREDHVHGH